MGREKLRIRISINCHKRDISSEDCQEQDRSEILPPLTFQWLSERSSPFFDDEGRHLTKMVKRCMIKRFRFRIRRPADAELLEDGDT